MATRPSFGTPPVAAPQDEERIVAMSCRGLTVDWEDNRAFPALVVDEMRALRRIAGQQKSFPQNIEQGWG
jgi:hypothetical protein